MKPSLLRRGWKSGPGGETADEACDGKRSAVSFTRR